MTHQSITECTNELLRALDIVRDAIPPRPVGDVTVSLSPHLINRVYAADMAKPVLAADDVQTFQLHADATFQLPAEFNREVHTAAENVWEAWEDAADLDRAELLQVRDDISYSLKRFGRPTQVHLGQARRVLGSVDFGFLEWCEGVSMATYNALCVALTLAEGALDALVSALDAHLRAAEVRA